MRQQPRAGHGRRVNGGVVVIVLQQPHGRRGRRVRDEHGANPVVDHPVGHVDVAPARAGSETIDHELTVAQVGEQALALRGRPGIHPQKRRGGPRLRRRDIGVKGLNSGLLELGGAQGNNRQHRGGYRGKHTCSGQFRGHHFLRCRTRAERLTGEDAVSVNLSAPLTEVTQPRTRLLPGGRIEGDGITMNQIMQLAWDITTDELVAKPHRIP